MLRLSSGHTAFVIAAGIVDGTQVEMEGQPQIIKGSTRKGYLPSRAYSPVNQAVSGEMESCNIAQGCH